VCAEMVTLDLQSGFKKRSDKYKNQIRRLQSQD
jgi:hypothetical protein